MKPPYELTGRTNQKARTRAALVAAAEELLADGATPTVEQAADHAGISRTTAYRYFKNQRELLVAAYPQLEAPSLLEDDAPTDPLERLDIVVEHFLAQLLEHEGALRAHLRLSLEAADHELPLRKGRAIAWFEDAVGDRRLALQIRSACGIEALVWLTDVAGLDRDEAAALMRDSARALARGYESP